MTHQPSWRKHITMIKKLRSLFHLPDKGSQRKLNSSLQCNIPTPLTIIVVIHPGDTKLSSSIMDYKAQIPASEASPAVILYNTARTTQDAELHTDCSQELRIDYVPLMTPVELHDRAAYTTCYQSKIPSKSPNVASEVSWPLEEVPAEIYADIGCYLLRNDIKAMRLTCKTFEKHVSDSLFSTVIIPFNTEIYDMLEGDEHSSDQLVSPGIQHMWGNSKPDYIYNGHCLDVFRGLGPFIKRYGMSFEVDELSLARPSAKIPPELKTSYWGTFLWPPRYYHRFSRTSELEAAADDTPKMKHAFSFLRRVQELALSIDSGLGWLNGPDTTIRTQVLSTPSPVFSSTKEQEEFLPQGHKELWQLLNCLHRLSGTPLRYAALKETALRIADTDVQRLIDQHPYYHSPSDLRVGSQVFAYAGVHDTADAAEGFNAYDKPCAVEDVSMHEYFDATEESSVHEDPHTPNDAPKTGRRGLFFTVNHDNDSLQYKSGRLVPNCLTKSQKEWLLETGWAQCALLSSYIVSVMDNPMTFRQVHTLTLSRISSGYLAMLERVDFWTSLPSLKNVTIKVSADWRTLSKDTAGAVEASNIEPTEAVIHFNRLLYQTIASIENIKTLTVGWACGGEQAVGVCARNKHLLPAPVLLPDFLRHSLSVHQAHIAATSDGFPHLECLTISNSWVVSSHLIALVRVHKDLKLERLVLDSVSLVNGELDLLHWQQHLPDIPFTGVLQPRHDPLYGGTSIAPYVVGAPQPQYDETDSDSDRSSNDVAKDGDARLFPRRFLIRAGSWPWIFDVLSPKTLAFSSEDTGSPTDEDDTTTRVLKHIDLLSCGYASIRLDIMSYFQAALPDHLLQDAHFKERYRELSACMMEVTDEALGEIVPDIPIQEADCLRMLWGCTLGWEDTETAEAATFDGRPPGGTGRFSGSITIIA